MHCYPKDTATRFQLDELLVLLAEHCMSSVAKNNALALAPIADADGVHLLLEQTWEFFRVMEEGMSFPTVRFPDVRNAVASLELQNAILEGEDMMAIRETVEVSNQLIRYLQKNKEELPALFQLTEGVDICKEVVEKINKVLEPPGIVKSNASRKLADIRKTLSSTRQQANRLFQTEMRKRQRSGWLRDFNESVWNDRRVLAVKAEYKRQIKGIYHGSSDSGQTSFIEPEVTVGINNEVAELEQDERREVLRILRELTAVVSGYLYEIKVAAALLAEADLTRAKALLSRDLEATKPRISKRNKTQLMQARHPLLFLQNKEDDKETVPLDLEMHEGQKIIIISGPNAGGKSIALKTLGLLQMMLQCGMMLPVGEASEMRLFKAILVDIGDDQSIEMELSTYSSRLVKMKYFLGYAGEDTFFFIDEFGTGSDPDLGGAVAEAILEQIAATGAYGVITTHYTNIKLLAERTPGMVNACMLFDEESLRPLYQLVTGQPGSSYTFEVATRIGLDEELLDAARGKVDLNRVQLESMLVKLQEEQQSLEKSRKNLAKELESTEAKGELYDELLGTVKSREAEEKQRRSEVNTMMDLGQKMKALMDLYDQKGDKKAVTKKLMILLAQEKARRNAKRKAERVKNQKEKASKKAKTQNTKRQADKKRKAELARQKVEVGSKVRLKGGREKGVVESIEGQNATIVFGIMKTFAKVKDLQVVEKKKK